MIDIIPFNKLQNFKRFLKRDKNNNEKKDITTFESIMLSKIIIYERLYG